MSAERRHVIMMKSYDANLLARCTQEIEASLLLFSSFAYILLTAFYRNHLIRV